MTSEIKQFLLDLMDQKFLIKNHGYDATEVDYKIDILNDRVIQLITNYDNLEEENKNLNEELKTLKLINKQLDDQNKYLLSKIDKLTD